MRTIRLTGFPLLVLWLTLALTLCTMERVWAYSVAYKETVTSHNRKEVSRVFIKDRSFRVEGTSEGKAAVIIYNTDGLFAYVPSENTVLKISEPSSSMGLMRHMYDFMGYLKEQKGRYIASETLQGISCAVYEYTDSQTHNKTRVWIWEEHQFPLRMEVSGKQGTTVIENGAIQFEPALKDSLFQLPAGAQRYDLSTSPDVGQVMKNIQ